MDHNPFVGSEALATGRLSWHRLGRYHRAVMPNVYQRSDADLSLPQRAQAAWLWSHRQAVIAGSTAAALHGARWVDDDAVIELIWRNARAPAGVKTRSDLLLPGETQAWGAATCTTPARTAFDLGRRGPLRQAVVRLDDLARATGFRVADVLELAQHHRHTRGLRQLETALGLVDPGAESPRETRLRLSLIKAGFPPPQTQIPVLRPDGGYYYLDMGWEDIMLAVEYDGDQHRTSRQQYVWDAERLEYLTRIGWTHIKVLKEHRECDVVDRVRRARDLLTGR